MPHYAPILLRLLRSAATAMQSDAGDQRPEAASDRTRDQRQNPVHGQKHSEPQSWRRIAIGFISIGLLSTAAIGYFTGIIADWTGSQSTSQFMIAAMTRVGLVTAAMWLAWDSMRRPALWLPPGLAVIGVIGIVIVAAQPRLIIAIVPLIGGLAILTSVLRILRPRQS